MNVEIGGGVHDRAHSAGAITTCSWKGAGSLDLLAVRNRPGAQHLVVVGQNPLGVPHNFEPFFPYVFLRLDRICLKCRTEELAANHGRGNPVNDVPQVCVSSRILETLLGMATLERNFVPLIIHAMLAIAGLESMRQLGSRFDLVRSSEMNHTIVESNMRQALDPPDVRLVPKNIGHPLEVRFGVPANILKYYKLLMSTRVLRNY